MINSQGIKLQNGLRQGGNISKILLSLFLNDVQHYLSKNMQVGLNIPYQYLNSFFKNNSAFVC